MAIQTNVTLLIPNRKIYCDFSFNLFPTTLSRDPEALQGVWEETTWKITPKRPGYSRLNPFPDTKGDAFVERNTSAFMQNNIPGVGGARIFMFNFGHIAKTLGLPPGTAVEPLIGYAVLAVDDKQHAFPQAGKEFWAKESMLIPQNENIIGIFWG